MSEPAPQPGRPWELSTEWLRGEGVASDVVVSSRVRIARNLAGHPFANRASAEERGEVLERCKAILLTAGICERIAWFDLHESGPLERSLLVERHLISKQHAKGRRAAVKGSVDDDPRAVAVSVPGERLSVMVNEEDHLRVQIVRSGLCLGEAWGEADRIDDRIGEGLEYAYSPRWGYLTACPTNVGTGVRMSVMLHLPGLKLTGDIEKVKKASADMNLAVRGFYGEGSDAVGDLYQISNQATLGKPEGVLLHELEQEIIPQIIEYERLARRTLAGKRRSHIEDVAWRALGLLSHARLLATEEAMQQLSHVRLGVMLGLLPGPELKRINQLLLMCQPAHVQRAAGRELDQEQRRVARAELVRTALAG